MTTGQRLAIIMKDAGMNQVEFAEELKISHSAVNRLVNDAQPLREATLELLALKFNANREWILTGEGSKYSNALIDSLNDTLRDFPAVQRALKLASERMTKKDWQKLNDFLESLGGAE